MTTLRDIAVAIEPISPQVNGSVVFDSFEADPDLMAIPVIDAQGAPVGLVERNHFSLQMGSAYGRALFAGRPIALTMDTHPLVVDEHAPVSDFTEEALARRPGDLLKGIIVVSDGRYAGVVTITDLLKAITASSRRAAQDLAATTDGLVAAKAETQAANTLLREALDAMSEGVAIFDAEDRYLLWNAKYAESHRESSDILRPGLPFETLLRHGLARGQYVEAIGREEAWLAERMGHCARLEGRWSEEQALPDGRFIRVEDTRLPNGGSISVAVDITEVKQRGASFLLLFENSPMPLVVLDFESHQILAVNEAAARLYGYPPSRMTQMNALDVFAPEDQIGQRNLSRADLDLDGRTWRHRTASGEPLSIHTHARRFTYDNKPAVVVALVDVTLKERAEASMKAALQQAEAANRAKSEFLANMSHEIRTPLNGVLGVVSVLGQTALDARQAEMIGIVESSARTLQVLLDDLLDLAKIESGLLDLQPEPVRPAEIAHRIASLFKAVAAEKGLAFALDMDDEASRPIMADPKRLSQILTNLCSNAVKFTDQGSVRLSLKAEQRGPAQRLTITVIDTGIGMSETSQARLFERFAQADGSINRRYGGAGLGLSISQQLAHLMGGAITVESTAGQGSTFRLTLDFPRASIADPPIEAAVAAPAAAPESQSQALRVLLVEDHPVNRRVVELILGDMVDLTMAENGVEGVQAHASTGFDLILMDMQMPVMDGLEATRRIREIERAQPRGHTPIIVLTANALPEHIEACLAAGADRHLAKPISAPALISAIEDVLAA